MKKRRLLSEINPFFYKLSTLKGIFIRHLQNTFSSVKFATERSSKSFPALIDSESNDMIKKGPGINPDTQFGKAKNIEIAANAMNGLVIHPGESFSFWKYVGKITPRRGFKAGRVIKNDRLIPGIGGGLCNLANTLNLLVLHSPLDVTEFHHHSDALNPEKGEHVPFGTGTSVAYNYVDYRFKNNTDQSFQLLVWCKDNKLYAELRSQFNIKYTYKLLESDYHFSCEEGKYYRVSKIYREIIDASSHRVFKELILKNHSEVMYDYDLIPQELIRR